MKVNFEHDESSQGISRAQQAKALICELILLAHKRGRPSKKERELDEAA